MWIISELLAPEIHSYMCNQKLHPGMNCTLFLPWTQPEGRWRSVWCQDRPVKTQANNILHACGHPGTTFASLDSIFPRMKIQIIQGLMNQLRKQNQTTWSCCIKSPCWTGSPPFPSSRLSASTTPQLVVDAAGLVAGSAQDVQATRLTGWAAAGRTKFEEPLAVLQKKQMITNNLILYFILYIIYIALALRPLPLTLQNYNSSCLYLQKLII